MRYFVLKRAHKSGTPAKKEEQPFTAWGEAVGGLQAGLGFKTEQRAYTHGEMVTLVVHVRNVGNKYVKFEYLRQYFNENPPVVTSAAGTKIPLKSSLVEGLRHEAVEVTLGPGKDIALTGSHPFYELMLELGPSFGTGKVQVQYDRVFGNSSIGQIKLDPVLSTLATGKLELEIMPVEPAPKRISFKEAKELVEGLGGQCYGDNNSDEPDARVQLNGKKVDDATIRKLAGYPKLRSLWLFGMVSVTDDGLAALAHCTSLENLQMQAPAVTDAGLMHLARLTKLEHLTLSNTQLTDEGLRHVATLPQLTDFSLWSDNVGDAGMQHLARMTSLKSLSSYCPKVTNDGLKTLAQSASLESLSFSSDHVSDEGMAHLGNLKSLRSLAASVVRLTDESLKAIGVMANLESLSLSGTKITDAGMEHLKGLKKVERLHFHGNRSITGEGLSHLHGLPLKQFTLMGPRTSDKGLEQLAAFPTITHLAVGFGGQARRKDEAYLVTDAGLKHLAALPALAHLSFDGATITDAGVVVLKQASLESVLCLRCPQLSAAGKKAWQDAAPHVRISGNFPDF